MKTVKAVCAWLFYIGSNPNKLRDFMLMCWVDRWQNHYYYMPLLNHNLAVSDRINMSTIALWSHETPYHNIFIDQATFYCLSTIKIPCNCSANHNLLSQSYEDPIIKIWMWLLIQTAFDSVIQRNYESDV